MSDTEIVLIAERMSAGELTMEAGCEQLVSEYAKYKSENKTIKKILTSAKELTHYREQLKTDLEPQWRESFSFELLQVKKNLKKAVTALLKDK